MGRWCGVFVAFNFVPFNLRIICSFCRLAPSCQRNDVACCRWSSHAESASRRRRIADVQMPSNRRRPPLEVWAWAAIRQFRRQRPCSRMHLAELRLVSPEHSSPRVPYPRSVPCPLGHSSFCCLLSHPHTHTYMHTNSLTYSHSASRWKLIIICCCCFYRCCFLCAAV